MKKESKMLDIGLYELNSNNKEVDSVDVKTVFTMRGQQDQIEEGLPILLGENAEDKDVAYAKVEVVKGQTKYYVRVNDIGDLFDPSSLAPEIRTFQGKLLKDDKSRRFVKVNQKCFDQYLIFLKTGNKLHFKFAVRERI